MYCTKGSYNTKKRVTPDTATIYPTCKHKYIELLLQLRCEHAGTLAYIRLFAHHAYVRMYNFLF